MNARSSIPNNPAAAELGARIRDLVPLNALADELFQQLLDEIDARTLAKGEFLFKEGDSDHENVYLLAGQVQLMAGKRVVDQVVASSNIARFPLAHQWPRRYSARAAEAVQYIRVDSRLLSDLLVRTQDQSYRVAELDAEGSDDWMSQVLKSRLFEQIPAANIQNVLRRMEKQEVGKGDVVIRQGDRGKHYFMVVRGKAVVTRLKDDKVEVLAHLGPGDGFGEDALISGQPRGAAVTMEDRGVLVRLGEEDFLEWVYRPLARSLDIEAGMARAEEGAIWLDIRSEASFARGSLPGAVNVPMELLRARSADLDPQGEYLLCGDDAGEVAAAAFILLEQGLQGWALDRSLAEVAEGILETDKGLDVSREMPAESAADLPGGKERAPSEAVPTPDMASQDDVVAEMERLRGEIATRDQEVGDLRRRLVEREADMEALRQHNESLAQRVAELKAELDESEEVLQEASAQESAQQWERMRLQTRIEQLEQALAEQKSVNAVLEEENAAALRRIEMLQRRMEPKSVARYD